MAPAKAKRSTATGTRWVIASCFVVGSFLLLLGGLFSWHVKEANETSELCYLSNVIPSSASFANSFFLTSGPVLPSNGLTVAVYVMGAALLCLGFLLKRRRFSLSALVGCVVIIGLIGALPALLWREGVPRTLSLHFSIFSSCGAPSEDRKRIEESLAPSVALASWPESIKPKRPQEALVQVTGLGWSNGGEPQFTGSPAVAIGGGPGGGYGLWFSLRLNEATTPEQRVLLLHFYADLIKALLAETYMAHTPLPAGASEGDWVFGQTKGEVPCDWSSVRAEWYAWWKRQRQKTGP